MTVSPANTTIAALTAQVIAKLDGEGYSFNRLTTTFDQYLATALSGINSASFSARSTNVSTILALLAVAAGSTGSNLANSDLELMSRIINGNFDADDEIDANIVVTGTFTPPSWNFVAPSPDIGGSGVTAAQFAIAPTGWWLLGDISDGEADYSGAETITSVNVTAIIGDVSLTSKSVAALTLIDLDSVMAISGSVSISFLPALDTFTANSLKNIVGLLGLHTLSAMTEADVSSLTDMGGAITFSEDPEMVTMTVPSFLIVSGDISLNANGFDQATVDGWLAASAAMDGTGGTTSWDNLTLDLSGGTNSPPSGAGLTDKATLEGRGNAVLVNSVAGPIVSSVLHHGGNLFQVGDVFSVNGDSDDATGVVDTVSNDPTVYAITDSVDHTFDRGTITGIDQGTQTITVSGDITPNLVVGLGAQIIGSTGNDMQITVASFAPNGGGTDVIINESLPDATADGFLDSWGVISIDGDHVSELTDGVVFVTDNADGLDGGYSYQTAVTDFDFGSSGKTRLFATSANIVGVASISDGDINILGDAAVVTYHLDNPGTAYHTTVEIDCPAGGGSLGHDLTLDITV